MVMHARKIQRLDDGYFERSQSHSYDNSVKYSSKSLEIFNNKLHHKSPSGPGRNESPSNRPSPHYSHKNSYSQRIREKERRDSCGNLLNLKESSKKLESRERFPLQEKITRTVTFNTEPNNNDSKICEEKVPEKKRKYNYPISNKSPHIKDRTKCNASTSNCTARDNSFISSSFKNSSSENSRGSNSSYRGTNHESSRFEEKDKRQQVGDWSEHMSSSGKRYYYNCKTEVSQWEKPKEWLEWEKHHGTPKATTTEASKTKSHTYDHHYQSSSGKDKHSNANVSRPVTNRAYLRAPNRIEENVRAFHHSNDNKRQRKDEDMDISPNSETPNHRVNHSPSQIFNDLPKVISQLAGSKSHLSPQDALRTIKQALQLTKQVKTFNQTGKNATLQTFLAPGPKLGCSGLIKLAEPKSAAVALPPVVTPEQQAKDQASTVAMLLELASKEPTVALEGTNHVGSNSPVVVLENSLSRPTSPTSGLGGLPTGASTLGVLKPSMTTLTPSLANYYREDLISHIAGWQADIGEKQANRCCEEALTIGNLGLTKLSTELKMARSQVRVFEIQATFQEQRLIFLRQQSRITEEVRIQKFTDTDES